MNIRVTIKHSYGNTLVYPICEKAKMFAQLANQKTLTNKEIGLIKALGYTIEVVSAEPKVL